MQQFSLFAGSVEVTTQIPPCKPFADINPICDVQGLRRSAESMQKRIEFCRSSRLENTRKRRQEAEYFRREADRLEVFVAQLNNLADALHAGTAPVVLHKVRTKAHVQLINAYEPERPHYEPDWAAFGKLGLTTYHKLREAKATLESYAQVQVSEDEKRRRRLVEVRSEVASYKIPGFFRSTTLVVDELMKNINPMPGLRWLEPSAGDGAVAERLTAYTDDVSVCEVNYRLIEILKLQGFQLVGQDIMGYQPSELYDRIIGNPPFEKLQDIDHVLHLFEHCLAPGGRMAMVMSPSGFFRTDKKSVRFRAWVEETGARVIDLPPGSFNASGTNVNAKIIVVDKAR